MDYYFQAVEDSVVMFQIKNIFTRFVAIRVPRTSIPIRRLNFGIRNPHNFFVLEIFLFQKLGTNLVNYADSGDIKIFVRFPKNSIFKFSQKL